MTHTGVAHLASALKINSVLEHLNVAHNRIGGEGMMEFKLLITENGHLKSLNLSDNVINTGALFSLTKGLAKNTNLIHLDLSGNLMDNITALEYLDMIKNKNFYLLELKIERNSNVFFKTINEIETELMNNKYISQFLLAKMKQKHLDEEPEPENGDHSNPIYDFSKISLKK